MGKKDIFHEETILIAGSLQKKKEDFLQDTKHIYNIHKIEEEKPT